MDDSLTVKLATAMRGYAGQDLNGRSYLTRDANGQVFTIVSIGAVRGQHFADTNLVARIVDDRIVIDHDVNDRPLVDALLEAGILRRQIVLAYAGESVGDAA